MKYIRCNTCKDVHEVDMPPMLYTLFTAYCPRCQFVTQHRQANTDEIITRIEYGCEA